MFSIRLTEHSKKQLKSITKRNKVVKALMKEVFTTLKSINIENAIKTKQIKIVVGIPEKSINLVKGINCEPRIFEYRNFPKKYPYRIYFVKCESILIVLRIFHHQDIKNNLVKEIVEGLKYIK